MTDSVKCRLCCGSGNNTTGVEMRVNNNLCPRCGGYGTIPAGGSNPAHLDPEDNGYIDNNGRVQGAA